jgi:HK97 family phage major capsid protein
VLSHAAGAVDLTRFQNFAAVRNEHDGAQIGVIDSAEISNAKIYTTVRFSSGPDGQMFAKDVADGIRRNVSVAYSVEQWDNPQPRPEIDGIPVYVATKWTPINFAWVGDPADISVGVGRSLTLTPDQLVALKALAESAVTEAAPQDDKEPAETTAIVEDIPAVAAEDTPTASRNIPEQIVTNELVTSIKAAEHDSAPAAQPLSTEATDDTTVRHAISNESEPMKDNTANIINPNIVLTEREQKQYSLSNAIRSVLDGTRSGFEFDVSQQIAATAARHHNVLPANSFFMPTSIRATSIGDPNTAGAMTETTVGPGVLPYLSNHAKLAELGAQLWTLDRLTNIPRQTGDIAATWQSEDGSQANAASASYSAMTLKPRKLIGTTQLTQEALLVTNYNQVDLVTSRLYNAFAVAFDRAGIQGAAGGNSPVGLINTTGFVSGSASGSALSWANATELMSLVATANADLGNQAFLTTPAIKYAAMSYQKGTSTVDFVVSNNEKVGLYDCVHSNNVPAGYFIYGDWTNMVLSEFGSIMVTVDNLTLADSGKIKITGCMLADVGIAQLGAFACQRQIH